MNVIILAGGRGTRLQSVSGGRPKPLVEISGVSVLERQLEQFKKHRIDNIILSLGFAAEKFDFVKGVKRFVETQPLGNGGVLFSVKDMLEDDFFVVSGDLVFDIDFEKMLSFHKNSGALATVFAHPNRHPSDSMLIKADKNGKIEALLGGGEDRFSFQNLAGAGIYLFSKEIFFFLPPLKRANIDRDIIMPLIKTGRAFAYRSAEYVGDMGTPERYRAVSSDVLADIPAMRSLSGRRRAVFLDRDGTVNVYKRIITRPEQIELLLGAAEAVAAINASGYLAIIISNQPGLAKGMNTFEEMDVINGRLEALLGKRGAYLDGICLCPHHPEVGHAGEVSALKIDCDCRKPKPGLILRAAQDFGINLHESYMVGDNPIDCAAGAAAGCKTAFLTCGKPVIETPNCPVYPSLLDFVSENISARR